MKSGKNVLYAVVGLVFLISACQDEKGKGDYSGVSELISDRNKARYEVSENPPKKTAPSKKGTTHKTSIPTSDETSKEEELLSVVLYEEQIKVVGSESGRTLAKGVAYINKKGQIVRIKILKE